MSERDRIYVEGDDVEPFAFTDDVARVFPDMIRRSVPGYELLLEMIPLLVRRAVRPASRIYDLGCSRGAATLAARRAVDVDDVEIIAVDNAPDMIERCRAAVDDDNSAVPVTLIADDAENVRIDNASVVMMVYTLQFIPRERRLALLERIAGGMMSGGVVILAEKLAFEPADEQQWLDEHHLDFKRASGYSDLEIARKRQALENVLVADTRKQHHQRLKDAGFGRVIDWFQCFNFCCMAAVR